MVKISIDDNRILSKYKRSDIESKVNSFFKNEFGIDDELILYEVDLDIMSDNIKISYEETRKLKESDFVNY